MFWPSTAIDRIGDVEVRSTPAARSIDAEAARPLGHLKIGELSSPPS
jgi:hypothetical protein